MTVFLPQLGLLFPGVYAAHEADSACVDAAGTDRWVTRDPSDSPPATTLPRSMSSS